MERENEEKSACCWFTHTHQTLRLPRPHTAEKKREGKHQGCVRDDSTPQTVVVKKAQGTGGPKLPPHTPPPCEGGGGGVWEEAGKGWRAGGVKKRRKQKSLAPTTSPPPTTVRIISIFSWDEADWCVRISSSCSWWRAGGGVRSTCGGGETCERQKITKNELCQR